MITFGEIMLRLARKDTIVLCRPILSAQPMAEERLTWLFHLLTTDSTKICYQAAKT